MLHANMWAGLAHCLHLSYHEDARVQALFLTIFTKALNDGADFDVAIPIMKPVHEKTSKLCEVRTICISLILCCCLLILSAVAEVP